MNHPSPILAKIVQATGDLPAMPHVAKQVMEMLSNPRTTPQDLQRTILKDQALAARVLKIANSAFYGCSRNITRLTDAIVIMGFQSIKSLVMMSVLNDLFKSFGLAEKLLWEHSLGCATASKKIAKAIRFSRIEEAFLSGLLHDIGKVILNLKIPDKTLLIFQEVYNTPGTTFCEVEQRVLGFTHAQLGQQVARKWRFAPETEEAIGFHHTPEGAEFLPLLSYIVNLANAFCHKLEVGATKSPNLDLSTLESARFLNLSPDVIEELIEEIATAVRSQQEVSW